MNLFSFLWSDKNIYLQQIFIRVVTSNTVENGFSYSFWQTKDTKCPMKYDYIVQDNETRITEGNLFV